MVAVSEGAIVCLGVADVDDELDQALREIVVAVGLLVGRRLVQQVDLDALLHVEVVRASSAPHRDAHGRQRAHRRQELELLRERPYADENVLLGDLEPRRAHRRDDGLVLVLAERRDLARRRHLHAKDRVSAEQPREGEHGGLDANVLEVEQRDLRGRAVRAHHHAGREIDEVDLERLGHEGEGARRSDVGFDDLDVVVLREELDVERARDVEGLGDLAGDALHAAHRLNVELLRGQDQGRIARVDAGVLHVLGDRVVDDDTISGDGIDLDLLRALDELGDDHRVIGRHVARKLQELDQIRIGEDDLHRRARQHVRRPDERGVAHTPAEGLCLVDGGELLPLGLVDTDLVEDR
mmetsp:Transcript_32322/g.72942  ORF Transcript_32322/g.72942 Transcript_32322/m.72942 type:complete len:353 (-) Transcript_32322:3441-4499(-)